MTTVPPAVIAAVVGFVPLCMLSDLRSRRIPNALSLTGIVAGLALNLYYFGVAGLAASVAGLVLAVSVLIVPFAVGGIGGGDVKMMGALGALLGPRLVAIGLIVGLLLGGVSAAGSAARHGMLRSIIVDLTHRTRAALELGSAAPLRMSAGDGSGITLRYSVPLGLGVLVALFAG